MYGNLNPIVRVMLAGAMSLLIAVSPLVRVIVSLFSFARSSVWKFRIGRRPAFSRSIALRFSPVSRCLRSALRSIAAAWPWWSASIVALLFGAVFGVFVADILLVCVIVLAIAFRWVHGGW